LGIAARDAHAQYHKTLEYIGKGKVFQDLPQSSLFIRQFTKAFVRSLDRIAVEGGYNIWLEKTPRHLHYLKYIEKFVKKAKFIHIIRNGTDVVASLYEVTKKYPEIWGGHRTIDQCIERWISDLQITSNYKNKPNHCVVGYEELTTNPQKAISETCKFIGLEYSEIVMEEYISVFEEIVSDEELWKTSVKQPIKVCNGNKFYRLFNSKERQYIFNRVGSITI
jgi:hypothetical protein